MVDYKENAKQARLKVLDMIYKAQSSHIGSNFSVIDILTVLFDKIDLSKDKIVLSAGWKAASFYYFLKDKGLNIDLDSYCQEGSKLIGLTEPGIPGVLFAGGSMQMGLPAAVGFALSKKMKGEEGKVYCIMSDGELAGGMIWESVLLAVHHNLDNLQILVDKNSLQAMGTTDSVLNINRVVDGLRAIGMNTIETDDGHDHDAIGRTLTRTFKLDEIKQFSVAGMPWLLVYDTVKGKGVSFMENNNEWHYRNIPEKEYLKAKSELNG